MSNTAQSDIEVFIEETREILSGMESACTAKDRSQDHRQFFELLERGIHTIKGNAGAFGFEGYSNAARHVLETIRAAAKDPGFTGLSQADLALLFRFIAKSHQFLTLIKRSSSLAPDFFKDFEAMAKRAAPAPAPAPTVRKAPSSAAPARTGSGEAWRTEIDDILREAPGVMPRLDQLTELAASALARSAGKSAAAPAPKPSQAIPAPHPHQKPSAPPQPPGVVQDVPHPAHKPPAQRGPKLVPAPSRPAPAAVQAAPAQKPVPLQDTAPPADMSAAWGYAFEAWCASASLRRLADALRSADPALAAGLPRLREFLLNFSRWALGSRGVPLTEYLNNTAKWAEGLAQSLDSKIAVKVSGQEVRVLPLVGDFACAVLREVFNASLPLRRRGAEENATFAVDLRAESKDGFTVIRVSGLPSFLRSATGLRSFAIQQRVAGLGGKIGPSAGQEEIVIELPDDLHGIQVLVARTGNASVAIPRHRVLGTLERPSVKQDGDSKRVEWRGNDIDVLDLRDVSSGGEGQGAGDLVVLSAERGALGVIVDRIVRPQQEMLAEPIPEAPPESLVVGFCVPVEGGERIPLLAPCDPRGNAFMEEKS